MTCEEARERLLEADLAELDANGTGPLSAHLRTCAACRTAAERIVDVHRGLREARAVARPAAAQAAVQQALVEGRRGRRPRHRTRLVAAPLLAAAAIGAVLLVRGDRLPSPTVPIVAPPPVPPPLVESASGRVAVITTRRPDITVVWQF